MALKIGIVGLPNVGKSTLFNALTKSRAAEAQNYPFCTIDPNVGVVEVPDARLHTLADASHSEKVIPAAIEFVDIAGLVKGASQGEGLGNQFLSHIRECNAIAHVLRDFEDKNVTHVHGEVNPRNDREVIESELLLADLQTLEKRLQKAESEAKSGDKKKKEYAELLRRVNTQLESGTLAHMLEITEEERELLSDLHLLSMKPQLYIINVTEERLKDAVPAEYAEALGVKQEQIVPISAKVEEDLIGFNEDELREYLHSLGIEQTGLDHLIQSAYRVLGLHTYFTAGPKETRAWTIHKGTRAPQAAGVIHTDFEKGFIRAEVTNWQDIIAAGGAQKAKEQGKMRLEGKDYTVQDGDVMLFRFTS